jgi:hypothetical protein
MGLHGSSAFAGGVLRGSLTVEHLPRRTRNFRRGGKVTMESLD